MWRLTSLLLATLGAPARAGASSGLRGVAARDNRLNFFGVESIGWRETLHSISGGQPYHGVATQGNTTLVVTAGRHGSAGPADDFSHGLNKTNMLANVPWGDPSRPKTLNFATFGTLTATFVSGATVSCEDLRFGQGHSSPINNWWVGSKSCSMKAYEDFINRFICDCGIIIDSGMTPNNFVIKEKH